MLLLVSLVMFSGLFLVAIPEPYSWSLVIGLWIGAGLMEMKLWWSRRKEGRR